MSHPHIDIVVPVHNALEPLKECLRTLQENTNDYRLIFVDDFSGSETADYLKEYCTQHPSSLLIRTNKQKWFTRASNLGLRMVRTSPSVLLNSDCVLGEGWLEEMFGVKEEFERLFPERPVGLIGSVLSGAEQRRWEDVREPGFVTMHCALLNIHAISEASGHRGMPGWYLNEVRQDCAHIRSDVWLTWELNRLGYATLASFKSAVGHVGGKSWGHNLGSITGLRLADLD
jgi:glycosyltransferase involved in cell wall biosynthesis